MDEIIIIIIITLYAPFHHNGLLYGNFWVLDMGARKRKLVRSVL